MAQKSPQQVTDKLIRNLSNATQSIREGIQAVQESPMEAAAAQQQLFKAQLNKSIDDGKWADGLRRVSLQEWKDQTLNKGVDRIATGVQAAKPKILEFMTAWLPYEEEGKRIIAAMPKGTLADSIARSSAMITYNSNFKR